MEPEEPIAQRRRVEDSPPRWAAPILSLAESLPRLSEEVRQLKEQMAALSLSQQPSHRVTYPSVVTASALSDLASDPRTPAMISPFLVALAANFPSASEETRLAPVQQAYDHELQLRQMPAPGPSGHEPLAPGLKTDSET